MTPRTYPFDRIVDDENKAAMMFYFFVLNVVAAIVAAIVWGRGTEVILVGLLVGGEAAVMRRDPRRGVPLSHAPMLAAIRVDTFQTAIVIILAAQVIARFIVPRTARVGQVAVLMQRLWTSGAAIGAAYAMTRAFDSPAETTNQALLIVLAALVAQWVADEVFCLIVDHRFRRSFLERSAELGVGSMGVLMAVGVSGIGGRHRLDAWAPLVLSIPLLGAWFATERASAMRRAYRQTVSALSGAVEVGGFVPMGRSDKVADICERIARNMRVGFMDRETLRTAALLRNIGRTIIDEDAAAISTEQAASLTASVLEPDDHLTDIAETIRASVAGPRTVMEFKYPVSLQLAQILRVSGDFIELTDGDDFRAAIAVEDLYSRPGHSYDHAVLRSLERIVGSEMPLRERRRLRKRSRELLRSREAA
ncbi:MAG: hypothetical protein WBD02_11195 [Acidimicrobiia bacterium]